MISLLTSQRRRWLFGIGEVVSIIGASLCASLAFGDHDNHFDEMSRFTAVCFIAVFIGLFVICSSLKRIDHQS